VQRARISRRSFYELFSGCEECVEAALQEAAARARQRVLAAQQGVSGGWRARTRAGLEALLAFFDESPQTAHLLVVESLRAGPRAQRTREQALDELAAALEEARNERRVGPQAPAIAGEALVGAALALLHRRLLEDARRRRKADAALHGGRGRRASAAVEHAGSRAGAAPPVGRLVELTGPLMSMIVLPYLGAAAARGELARPAPASRRSQRAAGREGAIGPPGIRLTNRTILVLSAIGELGGGRPGPSNRQVALAAGVDDQGQASKLLARLRRQGLIESANGHGLGQANAWRLTDRGRSVVGTLGGV
jgi:AcrR family transcriptional regulator